MKNYDIAVIGAGPAGCMAAIRASQLGKKVILLERNDSIGHKLLLTGNGRCNLTNQAEMEVFLEKFARKGSFFRSAFTTFSNQDLMKFFRINGLEMKVEENGRVFPVTDKSKSVVEVLEISLDRVNVEVVYNYRLEHLRKDGSIFKLLSTKNTGIKASKVIIATGGSSYRRTGSTGDGFKLAGRLGHKTTPLKPGMVPLTVREEWVNSLKGISLERVGLTVVYGDKRRILSVGSLLFTHFGVSGPIILDKSHELVGILGKYGDFKLLIDFKPDKSREELENQLQDEFHRWGKRSLKKYLRIHLPQSLTTPVLEILSIDPIKKLNQISKKERLSILESLKSFPLTITGHLPLEKAMITCGGVSKQEINPNTMESRLVDGLHFAGEIISGCAPSGGYNLQQAFSTGYLAGQSAAHFPNLIKKD
jgi:predicted Rossmann fold flavoprotein